MNKVNKRFYTLSLALAGASLILSGCDSAAEEAFMPPPPQVSAAPVPEREVRQWDEFTGRIEAAETVELRPRVNGYIDSVTFVEGAEVQAGDVLFVLDQRPYRAALEHARAELAQVRTEAELARSELARAAKLAEARAISTEEHDQRRAAVARSEAVVRAAQAAVDIAQLDLDFTEVRAPISGRAGQALVTAGNLARVDTTVLTTIVSLDPVHVYFDSDESTYLRYSASGRNGGTGGIPLQVALAGEEGFPHAGTLDFMDNRLDPATGTLRARGLLANPDGRFTPGLFARVRLVGGESFRALLVDDRAILTDQDRRFVYIVDEEGRAMRRDIRPGRMIEGLRVIEEGLQAGERVIVHGVQKVFFPGMPVQATLIEMGDPPAAPPAAVGAAAQ